MRSKKSDLKEVGIVSALILFSITVIVTASLAGVNYLTKDVIAQHNIEQSKKAHSEIFPLAKSFTDRSLEFISSEEKNVISIFDARDEKDNILGIITETLSKGYNGDIKLMTGITINSEIIGLKVLSNTETPGLGTKITLPQFTDKFIDKIPGTGFTLSPNEQEKNKVDGITGATISSQAIVQSVNYALDFAQNVLPELKTGGN